MTFADAVELYTACLVDLAGATDALRLAIVHGDERQLMAAVCDRDQSEIQLADAAADLDRLVLTNVSGD